MQATAIEAFRKPLAIAATAVVLGACTEEPPLSPETEVEATVETQSLRLGQPGLLRAIIQMQRATARYHNLDAALEDGFVLLHECEERPGEGPVGIVYAHFGRVADGVIDPSRPDALLYEPRRNGRPRLTGVELVVPYALWMEEEPPRFFGAEFQREDEFGVYGLHVWVWKYNPEGLFAPSNPRVSCET